MAVALARLHHQPHHQTRGLAAEEDRSSKPGPRQMRAEDEDEDEVEVALR